MPSVILEVWRNLKDKPLLTQNYEAYSHHLCYTLGKELGQMGTPYELFIMDVPDEGGLEWLGEMVEEVLRGDIHVINRTNARTGRWEADACFTRSDDPEMDNMDEYAAVLARIRKRDASRFHPFGRNTKYEIYSWDSYEFIVV